MSTVPLLQSSRLILRSISLEDKERIFRIRQDQDINRFIDRPPLENEKEAVAYIHKIEKGVKEGTWLYWGLGLKENSELIGTICIWNFSGDRSTAEIGFELLPDSQKKGLMSEALETVIEYAFLTLHLKELKAYSNRENKDSIRLLERLDFLEDDETGEDSENLIYTLFNDWE